MPYPRGTKAILRMRVPGLFAKYNDKPCIIDGYDNDSHMYSVIIENFPLRFMADMEELDVDPDTIPEEHGSAPPEY